MNQKKRVKREVYIIFDEIGVSSEPGRGSIFNVRIKAV